MSLTNFSIRVFLYIFHNFLVTPLAYVYEFATLPIRFAIVIAYSICLSALRFLRCFEATIFFLSFAALIGAVTGVALHIMCKRLIIYLEITMDHEYNDILASSRKPRRTVASFRESRRRRRAKDLKEQQEDFGMALNPRHANIRTYPRLSDRPIVPMKPISPSKAVASHSGGSLPRSPTILEEDESDDD